MPAELRKSGATRLLSRLRRNENGRPPQILSKMSLQNDLLQQELASSCCDTEFGSEIDREPGDLVANSMKFA
jgi:hypothetical protein